MVEEIREYMDASVSIKRVNGFCEGKEHKKPCPDHTKRRKCNT